VILHDFSTRYLYISKTGQTSEINELGRNLEVLICGYTFSRIHLPVFYLLLQLMTGSSAFHSPREYHQAGSHITNSIGGDSPAERSKISGSQVKWAYN